MNTPATDLQQAVTILERLVSYNTDSSLSNLELIDYAEGYLRNLGVPTVRTPNAAGDKAALHALIGPQVDGGVVLSGHTDCVPVGGLKWSGDPFTLRRSGEKLYGRGACDMKGFDACCLASVPALLKADLKKPVHLLLSYDEETTCEGSVDTIQRFGKDLPKPAACIVGEPTLMQVADGQKILAAYRTEVRGHEAHSAYPNQGVSAIEVAVKLISAINEIGAKFLAEGPIDQLFLPPYATVHIGTISGGTARNIQARDCVFQWEYRGLPQMPIRAAYDLFEAAAQRLRELKFAEFPDCRIHTVIESEVPGLVPEPGSPAEQLAFALTGSNSTNTVSYATEAGQFQRAGIPTIICGPGSIAQAHQVDEYITETELANSLAFIRKLGARLS